MHIAQTNVQPHNQLREKGLPLEDLIVVHRAYELLTEPYPGRFQAVGDGIEQLPVRFLELRIERHTELLAATRRPGRASA